jgi:hypothetical protein
MAVLVSSPLSSAIPATSKVSKKPSRVVQMSSELRVLVGRYSVA